MKNSLFRKILAVGATLALVSSFFVAVPVSAAPGCNTWGSINMPDFAPNTELGVMDVAPDGTIFLAVWTHLANFKQGTGKEGQPPTAAADDAYWLVKYSTDGGFTWKNTNMPKVYDNDPWRTEGSTSTFTGAMPVSIKVSPMWPNNKNVYVALTDGTVWRLPNAGLGTPAPLRTITDEKSQNLGVADVAADSTFLWDMDIWADGTYNYLAVATDLDVFVIKDQLLAEWVDYQLNVEIADGRIARAVRFAPDFATSELIWALVAGDDQAHGDALTLVDGRLYLASADSPARWGYVFKPVDFTYYGSGEAVDTRFVDIAFDPDYTSALPQLYVATATDEPFVAGGIDPASKIGNLWFVSGEAKATGPGDMDSGYIFFENQALGSVQVSGSTIMVQNVWTGDVYTTNDRGNTWPVAKRSPAGNYWGHLLMSPNYATDKTVYSTSFDGSWSYVIDETWGIPRGGISGVYRSTDGGVFFDGISLLDMPTTYTVKDLAFDPKGGSQPVLMVINSGAADYIFYTADATATKVQWLMKDCMTNIKKGVEPLDAINLVSWDEAGSVVMLMGLINTDYYVFRSYDEGNSFAYWRIMPIATAGVPADWVVVDNNTISVAGSLGYWGTRAIGTEIKVVVADAASIARYGDKIAIGDKAGLVHYSSDAGKTWNLSVEVGGSTANTFVAFGPDGTLYAAAGGGNVVSVVPGKATDGTTDILITAGKGPIATNGALNLTTATGIWVSPDNTLYVMGAPVSVGTGMRVADGTAITLSATTPSITANYTAYAATPDVKIWVSDITVVSGEIKAGDSVSFYSADVKTYSSSTARGYIWVAVDGDPSKGIGEFEIVINDAESPFKMFEKWPADLSVAFANFVVADVDSTEGNTSVSRLLLGEKDNVWEQKAKAGAGLWGTTGSNLVWTIGLDTADKATIYALEDFNSGAVQGVTVKEVDKNAAKAAKSLEISWSALPCTSCYEIYVYVGDNLVDIVEVDKAPTTGFYDAGTALSTKLTDMDYATKYDVQVRACAGARLQSRLSAKVSATTECYNVAPTPLVPVQGMQDASLAPSFVWAAPADGCDPVKYDFQLSTDPNFGSFIIDTTVTGTGYTYTARDLAYDTNHYWRVRSVAADGTKSAWTTVQNFHTMVEPVEPTQAPDVTLTVTQNPAPVVTVSIPPAQTVTVPPAVTLTQTVTSVPTPTLVMPEQPTPAYIWVIVAVGAVLTIAVIVLIIRTRRAE